jgi:hypothetical protein
VSNCAKFLEGNRRIQLLQAGFSLIPEMTNGGGGAVSSLPHKKDLNPCIGHRRSRFILFCLPSCFLRCTFRFRLLQATALLIGPFKKAFHGILSL